MRTLNLTHSAAVMTYLTKTYHKAINYSYLLIAL